MIIIKLYCRTFFISKLCSTLPNHFLLPPPLSLSYTHIFPRLTTVEGQPSSAEVINLETVKYLFHLWPSLSVGRISLTICHKPHCQYQEIPSQWQMLLLPVSIAMKIHFRRDEPLNRNQF